MSAPLQDQALKSSLPQPVVLVASCGALVTAIATIVAGPEGMWFALVGTVVAMLIFGLTHLVDWVLASVASTSVDADQTVGNEGLATLKRLAYGTLFRTALAMLAIAWAVRVEGVDGKLAVAIAMPLYCGILAAEIVHALRSGKRWSSDSNRSTVAYQAGTIVTTQARI